MSHRLERLLVRLKIEHAVDVILSEFNHSDVEHALDRGLIALAPMGNYKLTEAGRLAIAG